MAELTPEQQVAAYKEANADLLKQLSNKINLASGATSGAASASTFDSGLLNMAAGATRMFANGITGAANAAKDTIEVWRAASNLGINFGNDAIGLRSSIGTTRLTVDEYSQVMEKVRQGMGVFGGTLSQGTKIFNELSYEFGKTNFAENLLKAGFTVKEYNEILALTNAGVRRDYANNKEAYQQAAEATNRVAQEMDKVAQIAGLSRKQQTDAMFERQQDARLQALFREASIAGNNNLSTEYNLAANKFRAFGQPVEGLLRDMFLGGRLSEQSIKTQIALGGENAQNMRAAVNQLKEATKSGDPKQIEAAQREFQRVYADIAKTMSDPNTLAKIRLAQGDWADILGKVSLNSRILQDQIVAEKDRVRAATGKTITDLEAVDNLWRQAKLLSEGRTAEDARIAGSRTTELYITIEKRLKDASTTLYKMMDAGNQAIGKSESVTKALDILQNIRASGDKSFTDRFGGKFDDAIEKLRAGNLSSKDVSLLVSGLEKEVSEFIKGSGIDLAKTVSTEAYQIGKTVAEGLADSLKTIFTKWARESAPTPPPRHGGTIGETGKLREIGSPIVQLKDRETVFTDEQLTNFASNAANAQLSTILDLARSLDKPNTSTDTNQIYVNMFSDMFKDIQTKISPANIPNTVTFDRESIENLGNKLSSTVESVASSLQNTETKPNLAPDTNFDKAFNSALNEFQKAIPTIKDTFNKGISELATVIPKINQTQARDLVKIIPSEIQQARYETQRQEDARRKADLQQPETKTVEDRPAVTAETTLDDIKEVLVQLNTFMGSSAGHLSELVGVSERQVRATKRLDPNVSVR